MGWARMEREAVLDEGSRQELIREFLRRGDIRGHLLEWAGSARHEVNPRTGELWNTFEATEVWSKIHNVLLACPDLIDWLRPYMSQWKALRVDFHHSDLTPLRAATALTYLWVSDRDVKDLEPLEDLTSLQMLYMIGTRVEDLGPVGYLSNLEHLCMDHTLVSDLGPLVACPRLRYLSLQNTPVTDIRLLHWLPRLTALSIDEAKALYVIGLKTIDKPWKFITQDHIDAYNALLDEFGGNKPSVRSSIPMRLSQMTARLEAPDEAIHAAFWLRVSSLEKRKSIWLPLSGNPYIASPEDVSKGIQARKTKLGRWRFEVVEKKEWATPPVPKDAEKLGVDVGLNVLATTSDGVLYGEAVKPKFDKLYQKIKQIRANRQRQGLKENSPRLDRLESRLSGLVKTETGRVANKLIEQHPDKVFVVEDLDLRGCRGQKRFAYRALQTNLARKAPVEVVNPAYTSQECPSCGYISRRNRSGTKFRCKCCGRTAHADWVGASGILRRSGDKDITCKDNPRKVKQTLRTRYILRRRGNSASGSGRALSPPNAPVPLGRRFTTRVSPKGETGTASKSSSRLRLKDCSRF